MHLEISTTRILPSGIERNIGLYAYGDCVFEENVQLRRKESEPEEIIYVLGERSYSFERDGFEDLMKNLTDRIREYEDRGESIEISDFGSLNQFSFVLKDKSLMSVGAPDVYKTGDVDSEAFKKLFE